MLTKVNTDCIYIVIEFFIFAFIMFLNVSTNLNNLLIIKNFENKKPFIVLIH